MPKSFLWIVLAVLIALVAWEMFLKDFLVKKS